MTYRNLNDKEIVQLLRQGCRSTDWASIEVSEGFSAEDIRNTCFDGSVRIGAGCHISDVGIIRTTDDATYGEGTIISVLNEAGDGNIVLYSGLTSQMAALMAGSRGADTAVWEKLKEMTLREVNSTKATCTTIGNNVSISNTRELTNVVIGDDCEIAGAARLVESTLKSTPEASILISDGVICDSCIIQAGASVTDNAKLYNTFVGEACHVGRGFTSENSVFFANSHMDNGEACAALCGPFSVSHHKSTLLIGGEYSFYNAGSNTNFSNHAYKMGPIHWGTLARGSKTASGAHILWPATTGAFTMVMGKVQTHPSTPDLPFAYLIAEGQRTMAVPGRNLTTVGTYRDIGKWQKRDRRPRNGRLSLIQYDWLNPFVAGQCLEALKTLRRIESETAAGEETAEYNGVTMRRTAIATGIGLYEMAVEMALLAALEQHDASLPATTAGVGEWTDMLGMVAPESEVEQLRADIRNEVLTDINDVAETMKEMHNAYGKYKWAWAYNTIQRIYGIDTMTEDDRLQLIEKLTPARRKWTDAIRHDAMREYDMGDVSRDELDAFLTKLQD